MSQVASRLQSALAPAARRGWWLFLVRGLLALAIGVIALVDPGATLAALITLLGAFFIVDGVFAVVKAVRVMRTDSSWWLLLLSGLVSIAAGIVVFAWPGLTAVTLDLLVGIWAIITGIFEVIVAFQLRRVIAGEWLYLLFGVISVAFGVYVLVVPGLGLTYLTLMIAIYGFVAGFALIAAAFRLRSAAG
jgi:uncharacterized membrane protein HdeD (DUF308 family)